MWSQLQLSTGEPRLLSVCVCVSVHVCVSPFSVPVKSSAARHSEVNGRANINGEDYSLISIISSLTRRNPTPSLYPPASRCWCRDKSGFSCAKVFPAGRLKCHAARGLHLHPHRRHCETGFEVDGATADTDEGEERKPSIGGLKSLSLLVLNLTVRRLNELITVKTQLHNVLCSFERESFIT